MNRSNCETRARVAKLRRLEQELENINRKKKAVVDEATLDLRNREIEIQNEIDSIKSELSPEK